MPVPRSMSHTQTENSSTTARIMIVNEKATLTSDWPSIRVGKDVFLHSSAPANWWDEYAARAARG